MSAEFDYGPVKPNGQYTNYPADIKPAYVQPLRNAYRHLKCGTETIINGSDIVETYATNPHYYGSTFCIACKNHLPLSEFVWLPDNAPMNEISGEPGKDLRRKISRY